MNITPEQKKLLLRLYPDTPLEDIKGFYSEEVYDEEWDTLLLLLRNGLFFEFLPNLEELYMETFEIETLPKGLLRLKKLKHLAWSGGFQEVPDWIGDLTSLEHLDLGFNSLTSLPESIGKLRNLKVLSISDNPNLQLPQSLVNLKQLESIEFWECDIPLDSLSVELKEFFVELGFDFDGL